MLKAILPGRFWTTSNGILVTVWGSDSTSLTIKMDWKDIPSTQPSGSRISWKSRASTSWIINLKFDNSQFSKNYIRRSFLFDPKRGGKFSSFQGKWINPLRLLCLSFGLDKA